MKYESFVKKITSVRRIICKKKKIHVKDELFVKKSHVKDESVVKKKIACEMLCLGYGE